MEHLKQIEDDLTAVSLETTKRFPEVVDASASAIRALKTIREAYVANVVRGVQQSPNQPNKFLISSELASPYIIICNYSDCTPKQLQMALNGLQLLLKHDLVPVMDYQNVLRVLMIQAHISTRQDSLLKLLQLVLQIATSFMHERENVSLLNEVVIGNLLTITLSLADGKFPPSIVSAAQGTARQIIGLMVDLPSSILRNELLSCEVYRTAIDCFSFTFREMIHFVGESSATSIKIPYVPTAFAIDCVYELLKGWAGVIKADPNLKDFVMLLSEKLLLPKMHSIQLDYLLVASKHGIAIANSIAFGFCRIIRSLVVDIELVGVEFTKSLIESSFLALQPCGFDQIPGSVRSRPSEDIKAEDFSIMSKFFPIPLAAVTSHVMGKIPVASQNSFIPQLFRPFFSDDAGIFHIVARNNSRNNEDPVYRFVSSHCIACCMDIVASTLAKALTKSVTDEENWRFTFNAATKLIVSSSEYISAILHDSKAQSRVITKAIVQSHVQVSWKYYQETGHSFDPFTAIHGIVANTLGLKVYDTLVFSILLLRITMNVILRLSLELATFSDQGTQKRLTDFQFLALPSADKRSYTTCANDLNFNSSRPEMLKAVQSFLDMAKESIIESFHHITLLTNNRLLCEESGQLMVDLALTFCFLNDSRSLDLVLTAICRHSISIWHGEDLGATIGKWDESSDTKRPDFNVYLLTVLMKLLTVVGDYCGDWDCVADCLNQAYTMAKAAESDTASSILICSILEQIVDVTLCLREENLVKFMTSFVALSSADIEFMQGNQYSYDKFVAFDFKRILEENMHSVSFVSFTKWGGPSSFAFSVVVSTVRLNYFRISSIWQMVTSHVRLVATSKIGAYRKLAVASLFQILVAAILNAESAPTTANPVIFLSDYIQLLKSDSSTDPIISLLAANSAYTPANFAPRKVFSGAPSLSHRDLLGSLVSLVSLNLSDVRTCIIEGIQFFLLHVGQLLTVGDTGGWLCILDILSVIPLSLASLSQESSSADETNSRPWSHDCLVTAFSIVKMTCEEFLEKMSSDEDVITAAIKLLQAFALQTSDVNISLTAIETMWKISGFSSNKLPEEHTQTNGNLLFGCLASLIEDYRPDVRHCALNTLFMALSSHSESSDFPLGLVFESHISPLLSILHSNLSHPLSASLNSSAQGKFTLHHSRDTASKQWTETLVLSHRGLLKSFRTLLKSPEHAVALQKVLPEVISEVVKGAVIDIADHESLLSCIDFLFGILGVCMDGELVEIHAQHILDAIKLSSFSCCGGNKEACARVSNYMLKFLSDERCLRIRSELIQRNFLDVFVALFLSVAAETGSPFCRLPRIETSSAVTTDDPQLRKIFSQILVMLKTNGQYPLFVMRTLSILYFQRVSRVTFVNGVLHLIKKPSDLLQTDIGSILAAIPSSVDIQTIHTQGKTCAMSLCNQSWIVEGPKEQALFADYILTRILLPDRLCSSLKLVCTEHSLENIVQPDSEYIWRCLATSIDDATVVSITDLMTSLLDSGKGNTATPTICSTLTICLLSPWPTRSNVVSSSTESSTESLRTRVTTLFNNLLLMSRRDENFEIIHRAIVSCIVYVLLIFEKEKKAHIDHSLVLVCPRYLQEYLSFKERSPSLPLYATRCILKQLINTIISVHSRGELSAFPFLVDYAMMYITKFQDGGCSSEFSFSTKFWDDVESFSQYKYIRSFENFHKILTHPSLLDTSRSEDMCVVEDNTFADFYHSFVAIMSVLDNGPLKDLVFEKLSAIDVSKMSETIVEQSKLIKLLELKIESLKRELQNTAALSTFPF